MWYIIFLLIIVVNVFYNYSLDKSIGYPPFLYSCVWFLVVFFHFISVQFNIIKIYELTPKSLLIFTVGVLLFTLGGLFVKIKLTSNKFAKKIEYVKIRKNADVLLILISLVFLPFYFSASYKLAVEYMILDSQYAGLRNAVAERVDIGFSKYGINFAYISFFIQLFQYNLNKENKIKLIISILILILFCILTTGRTFFIIFFCLIFGTLIVFNKLKIKYLLYSIVSIFLLFSAIGISLSKGGSLDSSLEENISSVSESFVFYFIGGLSAFDLFINKRYDYTYGESSLRFLYAFFNKIGLTDIKLNQLVNDFVTVPFETNVFTIYKDIFEDFGLIYMIIIIFSMSTLHTFFYFKAINERKIVYTFFYSLMLYPLLMSFFQEQYLSLMPTWIYLTFILFFIKKYISAYK